MFGGQGKDGTTYIIEQTGSLRATNLLDREDRIQSFSFRVESLTCSAVLIESSYQKEPQIKLYITYPLTKQNVMFIF
jgi:hypothetical protein